jgi:hypothetical protein
MNNVIKNIATKTFESMKTDNVKPEILIDNYVLELSKKLIFECSDVLREKAKTETDPVSKAMLKVSAVDILDHFGL